MGNCIMTFAWDSVKGNLTELQTVSTVPADFKGINNCAEIEVHPNGKFLYASNRGHDSIVQFSIDPSSGKLTLVEHVAAQGHKPRNFSFDPTGKWMIVTNHASDNAVVFRIDEKNGRLTQHGLPVQVPSPFCVRFLPIH
jgi:6-phosphogluconolactonase